MTFFSITCHSLTYLHIHSVRCLIDLEGITPMLVQAKNLNVFPDILVY